MPRLFHVKQHNKKSLEYPSLDTKNILLNPLMIVAGDHAATDIASNEEDAWNTVLTKSGYNVEIILQGSGSNNQFADLFFTHLKDAALASGPGL